MISVRPTDPGPERRQRSLTIIVLEIDALQTHILQEVLDSRHFVAVAVTVPGSLYGLSVVIAKSSSPAGAFGTNQNLMAATRWHRRHDPTLGHDGGKTNCVE
jgi:hypothetical protein